MRGFVSLDMAFVAGEWVASQSIRGEWVEKQRPFSRCSGDIRFSCAALWI